MPNLVNDFEVRKETLRALGGNPDGLANIFEVDKEILRLTQQGGSGIPDAPSDGKTYGRNNGNWSPVESGYPIKQGVSIDNNVVSVENYGQYTKLHGNFIEIEKNNEGNIKLYDKLEVTMPGEESKTASFIDILNAGNGVVKTSNGGKVKFWSGTQQEYDAIATKDANTLYIIS